MLTFILRTWCLFETYSVWFLVAALSGLTFYHAHSWKRDRQRLVQISKLPRQKVQADNFPLVSILVPAWEEREYLPICMKSLLSLRYANKQIVVCAGGSDGTYEIAKSFSAPNVVVLKQMTEEGKQRAVQRCYVASHGEVIFLTDADCIMEQQVFEDTLYPILYEGEDVATGTWKPWEHIVNNPLVLFQWSHHLYREAWLPDYPPTLDGRNSAIRREVIEQAEPFKEDAPTGTDYVQSKKITGAGYRIRLVRRSRVQTEYPECVIDYWRQLSRWFRTSLLLGKVWGDKSMVSSSIRSSFFSLFMLIFSLLALLSRESMVIWLMGVFHLALTQARVSGLARRYHDSRRLEIAKFRFLQRYLPIGWIGLTRGLIDSMTPSVRRRW